MLNSPSERRQRKLSSLGAADLKLSFSRPSDEAAAGRDKHTRRLRGATRRLRPSPAMAMTWRLIALGTEPGRPSGILLAWPRWEHFARQLWPTSAIPHAPYGLLAVRVSPYRDRALVLDDGTEILEGTLVGELHCNNWAILELVRHNEINPFRACREDLKCLAAWAAENEIGVQVQAFFGITMLSRAAARLGFGVRQRPLSLRNRLDRLFMTGLLLLYNAEGLGRLAKGATLRSYPQEVWMSRDELIRRYGARRPAEAEKGDGLRTPN